VPLATGAAEGNEQNNSFSTAAAGVEQMNGSVDADMPATRLLWFVAGKKFDGRGEAGEPVLRAGVAVECWPLSTVRRAAVPRVVSCYFIARLPEVMSCNGEAAGMRAAADAIAACLARSIVTSVLIIVGQFDIQPAPRAPSTSYLESLALPPTATTSQVT